MELEDSSGVMYGLGNCSNGSPIFRPMLLPPASAAPRLAASMIPGPPPVEMTNRRLVCGECIRPLGKQPCKLSCIPIVTAERTCLREPGRSEKNHCVLDLLIPKMRQRVKILRQDTKCPAIRTFEKRNVLIGYGLRRSGPFELLSLITSLRRAGFELVNALFELANKPLHLCDLRERRDRAQPLAAVESGTS